MLYIEIPENMKFACIDNGDGKLEDHFIDSRDASDLHEDEALLAPISIQQAVRDFLQTRKKTATVNGLNFNKNKPLQGTHIEYQINRNGNNPSEQWSKWTPTPRPKVPSGQCWHQVTFLSSDRRRKVEQKRLEQRHDRRHDGDSPCPT